MFTVTSSTMLVTIKGTSTIYKSGGWILNKDVKYFHPGYWHFILRNFHLGVSESKCSWLSGSPFRTYIVSQQTTVKWLENALLISVHSKLFRPLCHHSFSRKSAEFSDGKDENTALCMKLYKMSQNIMHILQPLFLASPLNYFRTCHSWAI